MKEEKELLWVQEIERIEKKYKSFFQQKESRFNNSYSNLYEFIMTTHSYPMRLDFFNDYPLPKEIKDETILSFKMIFEIH